MTMRESDVEHDPRYDYYVSCTQEKKKNCEMTYFSTITIIIDFAS